MGGNQSQESVATANPVSASSSTSGLLRDPGVHSESSERTSTSSSAQDLNITPLFLSASSRSLSPAPPPLIRGPEHPPIREEDVRVEEEEPEDMSEDSNTNSSALLTFHSFLSRSLRAAAEGSDFTDEAGGSQQLEAAQHTTTSSSSSSALHDSQDRRHRSRGNGHHHREHSSSSSSSSSHHGHRHHHHRHHHHHHRHHDDSSHERRSHRSERSRRRYAASDDDQMLDSDPFGLGISWTTLHQRLQALQGDEEGSVTGHRYPDLAGSGRHRSSRPHRSRTNGQLFFFRPPDRMVSCPYCKKDFLSSEIDSHKSACKIKPRVQFNEDKLLQDSGECSICLDDMVKGDSIARLPCLCIYHLRCLKKWYEKSQTCPAHPELT